MTLWPFRKPTPPTPSECARRLSQVRQDKAREARKAFHRELRERLGLPPREALRP